MNQVYLYGNVVFYAFNNNSLDNLKFVKGSISGELFLNDIYTEEQIKKEYSGAKGYKNLLDLMEDYNN